MADLSTIRPRTRHLWNRVYRPNYTPSLDAMWQEIKGSREVLKDEIRLLLLEEAAAKREQRTTQHAIANGLLTPEPVPPDPPVPPTQAPVLSAWEPPPPDQWPLATGPGQRAHLPPHQALHVRDWVRRYAAERGLTMAAIGRQVLISDSLLQALVRSEAPRVSFSIALRLAKGLNVAYEQLAGPRDAPVTQADPETLPDLEPPAVSEGTPDPDASTDLTSIAALLTRIAEGQEAQHAPEVLAALHAIRGDLTSLRHAVTQAHTELATALVAMERTTRDLMMTPETERARAQAALWATNR